MNLKARKRFGQNFLVDQDIIHRIRDVIAPATDELLIEIGPGRAALTSALLDSGADLIAVELDRDLAASLEQQFATQARLKICQADALKTDFSSLAQGRPYRLVGNLPYNISTPLIFHILQLETPPSDMHFMLQKEVVDRMAAGPGSRVFGRLSVMVQNRCTVKPLFRVGPESFEPRPRVESSFVRLLPRATPLSGPELEPSLDRVVRQAFSLRRKTLRNSLAPLLSPEQMESVGVNPTFRAEQLDLDSFFALAKLL